MGVDALLARLHELQDQGEEAIRPAAEAMAAVGERAIKQKLRTSSHPPRTRTPSQPGEPPSLVTGQLWRSVQMTKSYRSGAHQWTAHTAPTTVYARIQELGGRAGRGHRSRLPARPYVRPAFLENEQKAKDAAVAVFRSITGL